MKIAIIGSGISGLSAAYILQNNGYDVTVFEKNDYVGGHSRTLTPSINDEQIPIDTGFLVFNKTHYPTLTKLFEHLGVEIEKSNVALSVSANSQKFEYKLGNLKSFASFKRNAFNPQYYRLLWDIKRFKKLARKYIKDDDGTTVEQMIVGCGFGQWFKKYYLTAIGATLWTIPQDKLLQLPAAKFCEYYHEHGLIDTNKDPQWYHIKGGTINYIQRISKSFANNIKTGHTITYVKRENDNDADKYGVVVRDIVGNEMIYDHVIFACHPSVALKILVLAKEKEVNLLGEFEYQSNEVVLHSDSSFMPSKKELWSPIVYFGDNNKAPCDRLSLSYWLNNLQNVQSEKDVFVTLNPDNTPNEDEIINTHSFNQAVFSNKSFQAQKHLARIKTSNRISYIGAWTNLGTHEDGLVSAINLCRDKFKANIDWA